MRGAISRGRHSHDAAFKVLTIVVVLDPHTVAMTPKISQNWAVNMAVLGVCTVIGGVLTSGWAAELSSGAEPLKLCPLLLR